MNLDAILEVAMGLVVMWLTLSVAVSQVQEWISSWLGLRAQMLELAIANMLKNGDLVKAFYNHPLIQTLSQPDKSIMAPPQPRVRLSKRQDQAGPKESQHHPKAILHSGGRFRVGHDGPHHERGEYA